MQEKSKEYNEKEQQIAENRSRNTLFERRENLQKHESYASERRQYDAIRNGQTDRIQSVFQLTPDGTPGILSRNELRNSKNMFIAGITLFTRAAIEGGVPEETAYALSDGYIQTVEECTSKSSIEKLSQKAALRFAQEVQKSGMQHYSREIEAAVKNIFIFICMFPLHWKKLQRQQGSVPVIFPDCLKKKQECFLLTIFRKNG